MKKKDSQENKETIKTPVKIEQQQKENTIDDEVCPCNTCTSQDVKKINYGNGFKV